MGFKESQKAYPNESGLLGILLSLQTDEAPKKATSQQVDVVPLDTDQDGLKRQKSRVRITTAL